MDLATRAAYRGKAPNGSSLRTLAIRTVLALAVALPALAAAETTVAWDEADKHVGEEATVEGVVVDVHCSPLSCLLAFEPSFNRFTAVVQAHSFDVLPPADLERRYKGKRVLDGLMLKAPIIGNLMRKIAVARFCRTLSTLTASGVPILDGLQITARTAGNAIIEDAIMATRKSVEEGKTISEPLADTDVFPSMVVQMIAVGEQTGALDTMLSKIAEFYEDEVDTAVAGLMKLLEPVLIAFLGVAIGGIVIAMYMPMFALIGQVG